MRCWGPDQLQFANVHHYTTPDQHFAVHPCGTQGTLLHTMPAATMSHRYMLYSYAACMQVVRVHACGILQSPPSSLSQAATMHATNQNSACCCGLPTLFDTHVARGTRYTVVTTAGYSNQPPCTTPLAPPHITPPWRPPPLHQERQQLLLAAPQQPQVVPRCCCDLPTERLHSTAHAKPSAAPGAAAAHSAALL